MANKLRLGDGSNGGYSTIALKRKKITKLYTHFSDTDMANDIEIFSLPIGAVLVDVFARVTTAFSGGTIATYTISVGIAGTLNKYMLANSVASTGDLTASGTKGTALTTPGQTNVESFTGATSIRAEAITTVDNLNSATQGSIDFYLVYLDAE